ncbi:MAG TPA: hypothetical protein VK694_03780 [Verrucomicrobiae bacterium]|nr:hypothetical protein [Verrucomicrobiae bacterium]
MPTDTTPTTVIEFDNQTNPPSGNTTQAFVIFDEGFPSDVEVELKELLPDRVVQSPDQIIHIADTLLTHGVFSFTFYTTHKPEPQRLEIHDLVAVFTVLQHLGQTVVNVAQYERRTAPPL